MAALCYRLLHVLCNIIASSTHPLKVSNSSLPRKHQKLILLLQPIAETFFLNLTKLERKHLYNAFNTSL